MGNLPFVDGDESPEARVAQRQSQCGKSGPASNCRDSITSIAYLPMCDLVGAQQSAACNGFSYRGPRNPTILWEKSGELLQSGTGSFSKSGGSISKCEMQCTERARVCATLAQDALP